MTERQSEGWKVLNGRYSCIMKIRGNHYPKRHRTVPNDDGGPLTVFTHKHFALNFAKINPHLSLTIVRCLYRKSKIKTLYSIGHQPVHLHDCPPGTEFADSITCLE